MRTNLRTIATAVVLTLAVAAGCGDGDGGDDLPGAQPAPDVTTFEEGGFDDLPLHPRSEPISSRNEKDGVVARSYTTTGATPADVLGFYERTLTGWELIEPIHEIGATAVRARWARGDRVLVVSATDPGAVSDEDEVLVQYSLSLEPRP